MDFAPGIRYGGVSSFEVYRFSCFRLAGRQGYSRSLIKIMNCGQSQVRGLRVDDPTFHLKRMAITMHVPPKHLWLRLSAGLVACALASFSLAAQSRVSRIRAEVSSSYMTPLKG